MPKRENGEGTLYMEGKYFCWRLTQGGKVVATVKAKTAAERRERIKSRLSLIEASGGHISDRRDITVGAYLSWWLESSIKGNRASATYRQYEQSVRLYLKPHIGSVKLSKLDSTRIRTMMRRLAEREPKLSPRTRSAALATLKNALADATREMPPLIRENPASGIKAPKSAAMKRRALRPDAMQKVLDHCGEGTYGPVVALILSTGVRVSEALGWMWSDLDMEAQPRPVLRVIQKLEWTPKGENGEPANFGIHAVKTSKGKRAIPLGRVAVDALNRITATQNRQRKEWGEGWPETGLILTTATGRAMKARNIQRALDAILEQSGLPHIGLHDLRKTCGSHLARQKVPMHVVQDWLGHEQITTTARHYLEALDDDMNDAAAFFD